MFTLHENQHKDAKPDQRYQFKDGQTGRVEWETNSIFGIFKSDNGTQFTVADNEVKKIKGK